MDSLEAGVEEKTADGVTVVTQADQEVPLELLLENESGTNDTTTCVVTLEPDASPDCQTDGLEGEMVVSEDMTEEIRELQEGQGILPDEVHVSVTREMEEGGGGEDIGFSEAQLVQTVSADNGTQMVQAITLADGSTAYIQHPMKVNDVSVSAKLLEGQAIQLEDGTTAFVQAPPKDGIQAVQLEDGSTAYISTNIYSDQNNVNAASLSMETFAQQQVAGMIGVQASYHVGVPKTEPGGTASTASASNNLTTVMSQSAARVSSEKALAMGDKAYKCLYEGCGRLYTTQHHLKVHERSHTGDRPFKCDFSGCNKAFATGYGLKSHTRVHTGEKPYKCPEECCDKAFKTSGDLQKHVRTHTGERPFKCPFEGCDRSFTTSNIRKVHIRTHTGERPYICQEEGCHKAFASATNYKNHIRIHTGEKPYVCTVHGCGKRFTEYSSLYKHHVVHTHAKPYVCNHCGKNYRQTSTLAMHKRTAHGDDTALDDADQQFVFTQEAEPTDQSDTDTSAPPAKQARLQFHSQTVDPNQGTLIINTASEATHPITMVPVQGEPDEQMLAALRVAQESAGGAGGAGSAVAQAALHQLQSSPNITLSGEIAGQQIFVVTDPQQIEALQQLAQQQQQLQQQQHDLIPSTVAEQEEAMLSNADSNHITSATHVMTTTDAIVDGDDCLTTEVNTSLATSVVDAVTSINDHGDGPSTFTTE
ncbi:hypothetical protein NP493_746g00011 [Ridgeia piscesae]|uniref:Zinc finger protein 143 n=1 Tax=Ridgeia piscesae TaxID=27915 RepID=A0AAD9NNP0_RIDPI|nr:hypothetical protein NP493_746g00011 [Ridgeia piscesae]